MPMCQRTSRGAEGLAWLSRELWLELREQNRVCDLWKKGQAAQQDYRDTVSLFKEKLEGPKPN